MVVEYLRRAVVADALGLLRGRGLDIALEHGVADLDDSGEWVVGDLSRLDPD